MSFLALLFFLIMCAGAATFVGTILPYAVRVCVRRGVIDAPDKERKHHTGSVPPIGGMVMIPVFILLLPTLGFRSAIDVPVYAALILLWVLGAMDDLRGLSPSIKLGGQLVAAVLVTLSGAAVLPHLGHLFGVVHVVELSFIAIPFSIVCFVFFINALNMMDGVDGLAGGISCVMLLWLALAALIGGDIKLASAAILMAALLVGFLIHNMRYPGHRRATVFLGDTGALCLAFIIAWLGMRTASDPSPGMPPISMAMIILVPIMDAFALFITRRRAGKSAFSAGRDHAHHLLLERGWHAGQVTMILIGCVFITGLVGVGGPIFGLSEGSLTGLWIIAVGGYTAFRLFLSPRGCG